MVLVSRNARRLLVLRVMECEKIDGPKAVECGKIVGPGLMEYEEIDGPKAVECEKIVIPQGHRIRED